MFAKHPEIAQRWAAEYPNQGPLPQHVQNRQQVAAILAQRANARHR